MALTAFPLTCMDTQNDSYTRLRKCKKCGSGTRFNRAPLPTDACSSCGAIYAKVEEALDADPVEPGDQPLSGWVLFMLVTVAVTLCGAAVALIGWEGLALALIGTALYALKVAKDISKTTSSPWLRRFLAQPKRSPNSWERMSTPQRIGTFVGIYIAAAILCLLIVPPFLKFILTGQF